MDTGLYGTAVIHGFDTRDKACRVLGGHVGVYAANAAYRTVLLAAYTKRGGCVNDGCHLHSPPFYLGLFGFYSVLVFSCKKGSPGFGVPCLGVGTRAWATDID